MRDGTYRTFLGCLLAVMLVWAGCDDSATMEPGNPSPAQPARYAVPPGSNAQLLARVNGEPLPMTPLHEALVQDYGRMIAQQIIADEVVRQELLRRNLSLEVTEADIQEESRLALSRLFQFPDPPSEDQWERLLQQFLVREKLTRRQWDATMKRNVRLSRLAEQRVEISEQDLVEEFHRQYDGKLRVRHIQVESLQKALDLLARIQDGADFEALVFKHSNNPDAKTGGWLPEIAARTDPPNVSPTLLQAARAMRSEGTVSDPVQVGTTFHLLKLEEIIPPTDVQFSNVKDNLRTIVRQRRVQQLQQIILRELLNAADIQYINPEIRSQISTGTN